MKTLVAVDEAVEFLTKRKKVRLFSADTFQASRTDRPDGGAARNAELGTVTTHEQVAAARRDQRAAGHHGAAFTSEQIPQPGNQMPQAVSFLPSEQK